MINNYIAMIPNPGSVDVVLPVSYCLLLCKLKILIFSFERIHYSTAAQGTIWVFWFFEWFCATSVAPWDTSGGTLWADGSKTASYSSCAQKEP